MCHDNADEGAEEVPADEGAGLGKGGGDFVEYKNGRGSLEVFMNQYHMAR